MNNLLEKKVLTLAVTAGELMMKNGAEVYRVEDTVHRICKACRMDNVGVFTTLTGIFVSVSRDANDSQASTLIRRVKSNTLDLNKISELNSFAREFTTTDLSIDEGLEVLKTIDREKSYPLPLRILGAGCIAAFFSIIAGGLPMDGILAFLAGSLTYLLNILMDKAETNYFLNGFFCTAFSAITCMALAHFSFIGNASSAIIGIIMLLVPGYAITASMRDFLSGDMLSGLTRLAEALTIAASLATGTALGLQIWSYIIGGLI